MSNDRLLLLEFGHRMLQQIVKPISLIFRCNSLNMRQQCKIRFSPHHKTFKQILSWKVTPRFTLQSAGSLFSKWKIWIIFFWTTFSPYLCRKFFKRAIWLGIRPSTSYTAKQSALQHFFVSLERGLGRLDDVIREWIEGGSHEAKKSVDVFFLLKKAAAVSSLSRVFDWILENISSWVVSSNWNIFMLSCLLFQITVSAL